MKRARRLGLRLRSRLRSPPLFWRTFLLIVSLAIAIPAAWIPSVQVFEREPRAHQLAERVISIIQATRIALVYSDPDRRRELLAALLEEERLRVVPLEPGDRVEPIRDSALLRLVELEVQRRLGANTRLASRVNGVAGFWVSFSIDDDAYWVFVERDLLRRDLGQGWISWAVLATTLSLLVAIAIARLLNRPLAALSRAARDLGAGRVPAALPDSGPIEIRAVNRSFNRMVFDLEKLNQDRAVLLAGVSHDLRTPLTRLRLELELNELPQSSRQAMINDLEQMEVILRQFLDYARPALQREQEALDLAQLVAEALLRNRLATAAQAGVLDATAPRVTLRLAENTWVTGYRGQLARALDNLLVNAQRYGRLSAAALELTVELQRDGEQACLVIADRGPGIAAADRDRLVRPFERGDHARSGASGAGLGLAIVDRAIRLHGGHLSFSDNAPHGLRVQIRLPLAMIGAEHAASRARALPGPRAAATVPGRGQER